MGDLLTKIPLQFEPKRKNRFILRFPSDLGIQEWAVKSASRPKLSQGATEIPFLNTSDWVLGRYVWQDMNVTLRDPIGPSTMEAVMEWIRLHSESVTGRQGYAIGYKRDLILEMLDPAGNSIEKWIIKHAFITDMDGGELDYGQEDLAEISLTLKYTYAIHCY